MDNAASLAAKPPSEFQGEMLSPEVRAGVSSAISKLTETVKAQQPSLEDLARETLCPMLKSWVDENLPGVVERMVQVEIERVIRGR